SDPDTLRRVLADDPIAPRSIRTDVDRDLEAICLKCLEKDPARRYRSAGDLRDDLNRFLAGEPTFARPPGRWTKLRGKARRHPAKLVVLAIVAACAVLLLANRRNYETRLDAARRLSLRKDAMARE